MEPGLVGKCFLRFPSIPFIPRAPYDVIATDYDNYAVVSGAKGTTFVQVSVTTATINRIVMLSGLLIKSDICSETIRMYVHAAHCIMYQDFILDFSSLRKAI